MTAGIQSTEAVANQATKPERKQFHVDLQKINEDLAHVVNVIESSRIRAAGSTSPYKVCDLAIETLLHRYMRLAQQMASVNA